MNLKKGLSVSFGFHAVVILLMTVKFIFFQEKYIDISQAVRVDMVALPDKASDKALPEKIQDILKEEPKPEKLPEKEAEPEKPEDAKKEPEKPKVLPPKKEIPPPSDAVNLNKAKLKQKNALDKLKKLSAIEKIKQDLKNADDKKIQKPIKGRVLSAGTKLTGLDQLQSEEYLSQLDAQIKANWNLPQWMIGKPFKARVSVKIDPTGSVISKKISQSSGNSTYDEYCLAAIDKASPFPRVPEKFSEVYKSDGVSFAFPD